MKPLGRLLRYTFLVLTLLTMIPPTHAANRKTRGAQKERVAKPPAQPSQQEQFQKRVEQEIAGLKEDVYTRATWKKLEEVKQEADSTAGTMKMVTFSAAGIGFILGCVVTLAFARRVSKSDDDLRIT